jgi:hypothetical protein
MANQNASELSQKMKEMEEQFYKENTRNMFFKKSQKQACATQVASQYSKQELFEKTFFIIGDTAGVFIDYALLKMYSHPDLNEEITHYVMNLFRNVIRKHGKFVVHMNLESFTVSAAERNIPLVRLFSKQCLDDKEFEYTQLLETWNIYNTPSVIEIIYKVLKYVIEPAAIAKIKTTSKADTKAALELLFKNPVQENNFAKHTV